MNACVWRASVRARECVQACESVISFAGLCICVSVSASDTTCRSLHAFYGYLDREYMGLRDTLCVCKWACVRQCVSVIARLPRSHSHGPMHPPAETQAYESAAVAT